MHRREGGRGKQREAKVCHDGSRSPEGSGAERSGVGDQQPAKRPECGDTKTQEGFYFNIATT
jgi:hypothetical protein